MLTRTFVHLPGVSYATEARWWREGIVDWGEFLARAEGGQSPRSGASRPPTPLGPVARRGCPPARAKRGKGAERQRWEREPPLQNARHLLHAPLVAEAQERLRARDYRYFGRVLASRDQWRAVSAFGDRIGYLDIETTGGTEGDDITVIGLADGAQIQTFVKGQNLDDFPEALARFDLLVTFFGTGFDLPICKRRFPELPFDQLHVDLCYALKRLGYRGGLKKIEVELGLARSDETQGLSGWDAVRLWREYRRGSREALDILLAYNREDVLNMRHLLAFTVERLSRQAMER
jgi:hypothetical protein